jgi:hypothetical protein
MAIQIGRVARIIRSHLLQENSLTDDMSAVIDVCEQSAPHPDWHVLRKLPYNDMTDLTEWLQSVFTEDPPEKSLAGLWFGLFNPICDGTPVSDMYVGGASHVDTEDSDIEWASDLDYFPEDNYADSHILAAIYQIAYSSKEGLRNDAEYPLCLAYGTFAVKRLLKEIDPRIIISGDKKVIVTVGFDDGDYLNVGDMDAEGLAIKKPNSLQLELNY